MEEGGCPELDLLWWLFHRKNVMPWEVYGQNQGFRDLVYVFALREQENARAGAPKRRTR